MISLKAKQISNFVSLSFVFVSVSLIFVGKRPFSFFFFLFLSFKIIQKREKLKYN